MPSHFKTCEKRERIQKCGETVLFFGNLTLQTLASATLPPTWREKKRGGAFFFEHLDEFVNLRCPVLSASPSCRCFELAAAGLSGMVAISQMWLFTYTFQFIKIKITRNR